MADRKIIVMEGDKKVYEGPENRHSHNVAMIESSKFFGLSFEGWIKVAGFVIAITLFYYRTDDFMKSQSGINTYLMKFSQNSDAYHSAATGLQFEQGRPINSRNRARESFGQMAQAHAAEGE